MKKRKKKPAKPKLTPPDLKQCQAEVKSFMTLGPGRIRCQGQPSVVAIEQVPGPDGLVGSMSLCQSCKAVFIETLGADYARFVAVADYKPGCEQIPGG